MDTMELTGLHLPALKHINPIDKMGSPKNLDIIIKSYIMYHIDLIGVIPLLNYRHWITLGDSNPPV
jgi:hypothetical protein